MKSRTFLRENKSLQTSSVWRHSLTGRVFTLSTGAALLLLSGCGTNLPSGDETGRHITNEEPIASSASDIPQVVTPLPLVEPPQPQEEPELYSVVVQDLPVREVLFQMARGYALNIDVNPDVTGTVSINAIDQTLPQILERLSRQVDMRWRIDDFGNIVVEADTPFWRNYKVDYVNVARTATSEATVQTSIADAAGSTATLTQTTGNDFWTALPANIAALLNTSATGATAEDLSQSVITNAGAGVVSVRGTSRQHEAVANFLESVQTRSLYQVLIEATVVEVNLNDDYQAGVDWATLGRNSGQINFAQLVTSPDLANAQNPPTNILEINADDVSATIAALQQFGELHVLSSPKLMALNNQSAMLRVVNNEVVFTIDVTPPVLSENGNILSPAIYTTNVSTVPVGLVTTITPQISESDQVTLSVRQTISRIVNDKPDPNPALAALDIENTVPETQLSEMESILKVYSGQVAILGGLMQDSIRTQEDGVPVLSRVPGLKNLFSYRSEHASKTELIIFIRPVIVRQPSMDGDLSDYRNYLPVDGLEAVGAPLPEGNLFLPGGE